MEIRFHWRILYQISAASCMRGEQKGGDEKEQVAEDGGERTAEMFQCPMPNWKLATLELATLPHHDLRLDRQSAKRDGGSLGEGGWQHSKPSGHRHGDQSPPPMLSCTSGCPDESSWFVTEVKYSLSGRTQLGLSMAKMAKARRFELVL